MVNINPKSVIIAILIIGFLYAVYNYGSRQTPTPTLPSHRDIAQLSNVEVLSWEPRIFYYKNIISPEGCDHIIELGSKEVKQSMVVGKDGKPVVSKARTSYGTFLTRYKDDPVVADLADKISQWTQLPVENGEDFYLLRYQNGQEYKPHYDYINPENRPPNMFLNGNRLATVLTYLSDVEEGGETYFPMANITVAPKKGDAILFWNLHYNGTADTLTLHGGKPVIKGTKWCLTKWIKQFSGN